VLVDEHGVPLSLIVSASNCNECTKLDALLAARETAPPAEAGTVNLCLDAGYVGYAATCVKHGMVPHIRPRGEEKALIDRDPTFKPRRWVVELSHSWFNRFRKLLPRYEKTDLSYDALNDLAAAIIVLRKAKIITR